LSTEILAVGSFYSWQSAIFWDQWDSQLLKQLAAFLLPSVNSCTESVPSPQAYARKGAGRRWLGDYLIFNSIKNDNIDILMFESCNHRATSGARRAKPVGRVPIPPWYIFTPGERKALAKSKVHQWSRAHGYTFHWSQQYSSLLGVKEAKIKIWQKAWTPFHAISSKSPFPNFKEMIIMWNPEV
jgi:hypothetical protein